MLIRKLEFIKLLNLSKPGVRRSFIFVEPLYLANYIYRIHGTSEFIEISNLWQAIIELSVQSFASIEATQTRNPCARLFKMADAAKYQERLRHSLLDLARRLQSTENADTVDFAIFRLQQINRHLVQSDRCVCCK